MINAILGSKLKMTHSYEESKRSPVTLIQAGPCVVTQIKTNDNDGYSAIQLGFGTKRIKNTSKSLQGHLKKVIKEKTSPRYIKEIRTDEVAEIKVGDTVNLTDIFSVGDRIEIIGTSKGKGFAGGVKRWGFAGGPKTHGQSDRLRAPGSIGQGTDPGRVYKGKKMAGRMGGERVTVKNLRVLSLDGEKNTLAIRGAVPGIPGGLVVVRRLSEKALTPKEGETNE